MASVLDVELEQKTSEYAAFVCEYFVATKKQFYNSKVMRVVLDGTCLVLEYEGK